MIEFGKVTLSENGAGSRTVTVQLRMDGNEGDDDDAEAMDSVEVVHPIGFVSRPALTPTTEAAYVRVGNEIVVLAILDKGAAVMSDLAEGEARLYAPGNVQSNAKFLPSGETDINSDADHGMDVRFNSGGASVVRVGDNVGASFDMRAWMIAISATVSTLAGGSPITAPPDPIASPTSGAPHVKA